MRRIAPLTALAVLTVFAVAVITPTTASAASKYKPVKSAKTTMGEYTTGFNRSLYIGDVGKASVADYCLKITSHKFFSGSALVVAYRGKKVAAKKFVDARSTLLSRYMTGSVCYPVPKTAADAKKVRELGYQALLKGHRYTFQIYVAGNSDFKRYYRTLTVRVPKN